MTEQNQPNQPAGGGWDERMAQFDPRIRGLLVGQSTQMQFLLMGMAAALGNDGVQAVLNILQPQTVDFRENVRGMPLAHWLGKSPDQIKREVGEADGDAAVSEIQDAMRNRGFQISSEPQAATSADVQSARQAMQSMGVDGLPMAAGMFAGPMTAGRAPANAPLVFGPNQIPLAEAIGLSDDELRGNDVADGEIRYIRQMGETQRQIQENRDRGQRNRNPGVAVIPTAEQAREQMPAAEGIPPVPAVPPGTQPAGTAPAAPPAPQPDRAPRGGGQPRRAGQPTQQQQPQTEQPNP